MESAYSPGGRRPCLRCDQEFWSENLATNRVCSRCNAKNARESRRDVLQIYDNRGAPVRFRGKK